MDFLEKLGKATRNLILDKRELRKLSTDKSFFRGHMPVAVVRPESTDEVARVLKVCNEGNVGVTVHGGGSSLTGASIPKDKGIALDMSGMDRIIEINIEDRYAVVEPGVVLDDLNKKLSKYGYFYPPDPASSSMATVGGSLSTNAGGLRAVMYGSTKDWVLGTEAVLPNGAVIRTGERTLKRSIGYDLTALLVGSEGTLAVITKAILKIWPKPAAMALAVAYYSRIEDAGNAVGKLKTIGITPLNAEFMDDVSMGFMRRYSGVSFPKDAKYVVFVEIATTKGSIGGTLAAAERILKKRAISVEAARSKKKADALYSARRQLHVVMTNEASRSKELLMLADVAVPSSRLPDALAEMRSLSRKSGLEVAIFGHIGDGNIHANIFSRIGSKTDTAKTDRLLEEFARVAIRHDGSVSGEHGIGIAKKKLLREEFEMRGTAYNLELMKGIKKVFDPNGILNKGDIFD